MKTSLRESGKAAVGAIIVVVLIVLIGGTLLDLLVPARGRGARHLAPGQGRLAGHGHYHQGQDRAAAVEARLGLQHHGGDRSR